MHSLFALHNETVRPVVPRCVGTAALTSPTIIIIIIS